MSIQETYSAETLIKKTIVEPTSGTAINTVQANSEFLPYSVESTVTFAELTTGTAEAHNLFKVTGAVALSVIGFCTTNLDGATATIKVGTALSDAGLIASTTATNIDANEIWHDATPDSSIEATSVVSKKIVSQDVIYTIGTAAITAGVIKFVCFWTPITEGSKVEVY